MNSLDQYAQDYVEGRKADDNHWLASQIVAKEQVRISNLQYSSLERIRTIQGYHS